MKKKVCLILWFMFVFIVAWNLLSFHANAQEKVKSFYITGFQGNSWRTGGTAFFIEPIPGLCNPCILTADHVVDPFANEYFIKEIGNGTKKEGTKVRLVKKSNTLNADVALFTSDVSPEELDAKIWRLAEHPPGEHGIVTNYGAVWICFYDVNYRQVCETTAGVKTIGNYSREADLVELSKRYNYRWNRIFYHTAGAIPGFSGSPTVNVFGNVVGILVGTASSTGEILISVRLEDIKNFLYGTETQELKETLPITDYRYLPVMRPEKIQQ